VLLLQHPLALETWLTMHEVRHNPRCKETFDELLKGLQSYITG